MNKVAVSDDVEKRVTSFQEHGQTVVMVAIDGQSITPCVCVCVCVLIYSSLLLLRSPARWSSDS